MMFDDAPVPRPPQPTKQNLISSLPAACAVRAIDPANAVPASTADDVFRKVRRVEVVFSLIDNSPVLQEELMQGVTGETRDDVEFVAAWLAWWTLAVLVTMASVGKHYFDSHVI